RRQWRQFFSRKVIIRIRYVRDMHATSGTREKHPTLTDTPRKRCTYGDWKVFRASTTDTCPLSSHCNHGAAGRMQNGEGIKRKVVTAFTSRAVGGGCDRISGAGFSSEVVN